MNEMIDTSLFFYEYLIVFCSITLFILAFSGAIKRFELAIGVAVTLLFIGVLLIDMKQTTIKYSIAMKAAKDKRWLNQRILPLFIS